MRIFFVCKETKIMTLLKNSILFRVSLKCAFTKEPQCMCVHYSASKQATAHPGSMSEHQLLHHTHASWYSHEHVVKTAMQNCGWTTYVTWTILTMSSLSSWALNMVVAFLSMQGQKTLWFHQKYLNLWSKVEQRSEGFGTTLGWVINYGIFIFWGKFIPLTYFIILYILWTS